MAIDLEVLDRKAAADDEVNWVTAIFMGVFHVGAIAALFFFTWKAFLVSMFLWWVSGSLGIGMGYHRLLTHRGYKTPKWVEYVLAKDKFHVWITKYHYVPMIVLGVVLFAIGGLPFLLWGVFFRTVIGLHTTWLVNSATHSWGSRRFITRDLSTNSWWVALLTFGEGWHNNHHAHPVSARHGLKWYEIDFNWYGIWALTKLGLARQVYRVKLSELRQQEEEQGAPAEARAEMVSA